ncbi:MAG TPA: TSUP family transporter [Chthonomonadaceae bacterium]|nr:TSUP family transporter [Chthonomonadaceae bacterium]
MTNPPAGGRGARRRKLNQPLIKSIIVAAAAGIAAIGSAITGIAAHLGFAPMLTWMFGYSAEKAQGTALRFTIAASLGAIVAYALFCDAARHAAAAAAGALVASRIGHFLALHGTRGLLLSIGATIGAILAAPLTPKPTATGLLRALQGIAIAATLFTGTEALHLTAITRSTVHYALWSSWWQLVLLALAVGAITQAARLTAGTLLVPALFFLTAVPDVGGVRPLEASEAVVEALVVVLLVSLLPAWTYVQRGIADRTYMAPALVGGLLGGFYGGWLLAMLVERAILGVFAVVGMYFAAREIFRLATASPDAPDAPPIADD